MAKTKTTDIRLKEANVKFTKAKAAVDGTPAREAAYRKAKTELAVARQAHAETRTVPSRPGDAAVNVKSVATKAGTGKVK